MDRKHPPRNSSELIGAVLLILFYIQSLSLAQDEIPTNPAPVLNIAKLTGTPPRIGRNVFMIKLNHWLNPHEVLRK